MYLLNPATGPVNTLLQQVGIEGPLWFQSPDWSKISLTILAVWGLGNAMVIFLAAVLDVPGISTSPPRSTAPAAGSASAG